MCFNWQNFCKPPKYSFLCNILSIGLRERILKETEQRKCMAGQKQGLFGKLSTVYHLHPFGSQQHSYMYACLWGKPLECKILSSLSYWSSRNNQIYGKSLKLNLHAWRVVVSFGMRVIITKEEGELFIATCELNILKRIKKTFVKDKYKVDAKLFL